MNATTTIRSLCALAAATIISGCVSAPDDVQPTFVDQRAYMSHSCDELRKLYADGKAAVASLETKQTSARRRSIAYNWLLVVGAGALTKDRSEALGRAKGELLAIEAALPRVCGSDDQAATR